LLSVASSTTNDAAGPGTVGDLQLSTTEAFQGHENTRIGRRIEDLSGQHHGASGFAIIRYGRPAFTARVAMADLAEKTLDVQYYIWEADATGRILAERLVRAADRGVRVRVLLDDINLSGRDARIAALDAHPNIHIRLFNPFARRRFRALDFITDLGRVNHRMHNKVMIMDNAIALVGGRNVGAHYFEAHDKSNFRDLDIVGIGPIVREVSDVFDHFWNGKWSVPISSIIKKPFDELDHLAVIKDIRSQIEVDNYPFPLNPDVKELLEKLEDVLDDMVWAKGEVVWEDPAAIYGGRRSGTMNEALYQRMQTLEQELLIESAYFVPRQRGIEAAEALVNRGVKVRVLTNSLAANDVIAAHAGYSKYRRALIDTGVELYELRPDPGPVEKKIVSAESHAALHTKAIVFDRKDVFIGSFNLDPRSADINTEAGLYVESSEIARQVIEYMDEGVSADNAYRVLVDDSRKLRWVIDIQGERINHTKDPKSTWLQRLLAAFIRLLPVEHQL
jgi:putative cardiolipin synthase